MNQSTYPLELHAWYEVLCKRCRRNRGELRSVPEDFVVEEIPLPEKGGTPGPYLICRLIKTNWEAPACNQGNCKTTRYKSPPDWMGGHQRPQRHHAPDDLSLQCYCRSGTEVRLKDIILEPVGQANEALSLGDLLGNRFSLTIRDCLPDALEARVNATRETAGLGIPNYFGLQRFGATRPVTHLVGECILRGDFEQAVVTYIGKEFSGEPAPVRAVRTAFFTSRDIQAALRDLPRQMSFERAMLHYLYMHPDDYSGALLELPPKLLSMFVSAFQSYLFNCALSQRFDDGYTLTGPLAGDRLIFANGRTDTVTSANSNAVSLHISRGRCSIALFMPGKDPFEGKGHGDLAIAALLEKYAITARGF